MADMTACDLLGALAIAAAVTSVWRGAWLIIDALLLPERPALSAAVAALLGSALFCCCRWFQPRLVAWADRERRLAWSADAVFSYVGLWACTLVWRGVWNLWDNALGRGLPAAQLDPELALSGFTSHAVGLATLLALGAVRSLNAPPMLLCADQSPPLFGASVRCQLQPLERWRRPPQLSMDDWAAAEIPSESVKAATDHHQHAADPLPAVRQERKPSGSRTILRRAPDGSAVVMAANGARFERIASAVPTLEA